MFHENREKSKVTERNQEGNSLAELRAMVKWKTTKDCKLETAKWLKNLQASSRNDVHTVRRWSKNQHCVPKI